MGRARAIGLALAALLGFSGPAVAPSLPAPRSARTSNPPPCAPLAPLEIALDCGDAAASWLRASMLELDPLAAPHANAPAALQLLLAEQLASLEPPARVPEPGPLLLLAIGLGCFAADRAARARVVMRRS